MWPRWWRWCRSRAGRVAKPVRLASTDLDEPDVQDPSRRWSAASSTGGGPVDPLQEVKRVFELCDTDKSGTISRRELALLLQRLGNFSPSEVNRIMQEVDKDESGDIDYDEFLTWMSSPGANLGMVDGEAILMMEAPPRRKYNAVHLPLHSSEVEQTDDAAVFLKSPARQRRHLRQRSRQRCSSAPPAPGRSCARRHGSVDSPGSSPRRRCSSGGNYAERTSRRQSLRSLRSRRAEEAEGEAAEEAEEKGDDAEEGADEDGNKAESEQLHDGIMRRANEQLLVANLKQLARKQRLRYGGRAPGLSASAGGSPGRSPGGRGSPGRRRQQVCTAASDFSELYGRTVTILEKHMTLRPPRRRHTVTYPDLAAYDTPTAKDARPMLPRDEAAI